MVKAGDCWTCRTPGHHYKLCPASKAAADSTPDESESKTSTNPMASVQMTTDPMTELTDRAALLSRQSSQHNIKSTASATFDPSRFLKYFSSIHIGISSTPSSVLNKSCYALSTAPLITSKVMSYINSATARVRNNVFPMYAVLGLRTESYSPGGTSITHTQPIDNVVFSNTSAPWSAFICGQQGAGKSYTLSCLLENALLAGSELGENPHPLTGLVFHYDKHASGESAQICEAAYLCSAGVEVEVLVSPTNLPAMERAYALSDVSKNGHLTVRPLLFDETDLKLDHMLTLMAQKSSDSMPLYMTSISQIIRNMKMDDQKFTLQAFEDKLSEAGFSAQQKQPLELRMALLKAFMRSAARPSVVRKAGIKGLKFEPGHLTIIDLSCSTISESDVCSLYEICLSIFAASRNVHPREISKDPARDSTKGTVKDTNCAAGLIIAIDEAHKFLTDTLEAKSFSEELVRIVRLQRHMGSRVLVATQEPNHSSGLMDFCDVSIIHRFRSPAWFDSIKKHLAGLVWSGTIDSSAGKKVFETIVSLRDGEALIFASNAYLDAPERQDEDLSTESSSSSSEDQDGSGGVGIEGDNGIGTDENGLTIEKRIELLDMLSPLQTAYIKVQIRQRLTADGGKSQMAA